MRVHRGQFRAWAAAALAVLSTVGTLSGQTDVKRPHWKPPAREDIPFEECFAAEAIERLALAQGKNVVFFPMCKELARLVPGRVVKMSWESGLAACLRDSGLVAVAEPGGVIRIARADDATPAESVEHQAGAVPPVALTMSAAPLEDVLFMRDEMANLAWAIERTVESPIERPAQRYEAPDAVPVDPRSHVLNATLPRYLLSSQVPPNWIPLLPVQIPNPAQPGTPGQILTRLKRGAVLQPDGTTKKHAAQGEVLSGVNLLFYDEEVPREGARITRQRRLARWTDGSTWLWTSFKNDVGRGEGSSQLTFDQILEPGGAAETT